MSAHSLQTLLISLQDMVGQVMQKTYNFSTGAELYLIDSESEPQNDEVHLLLPGMSQADIMWISCVKWKNKKELAIIMRMSMALFK